MNTEIIKTALKNTEFNVDSLIQVIMSTDNPEVATLIMLGLYQQPEVKQYSGTVGARYADATLVNFDPIKDKVYFKYHHAKYIECWCVKGTNTILSQKWADEDVVREKHDDGTYIGGQLIGEDFDPANREHVKLAVAELREHYERKTLVTEVDTSSWRESDCPLSSWQK